MFLAVNVLNKFDYLTYLTGKFTMVGFFSTKNVFFVNLCEKKNIELNFKLMNSSSLNCIFGEIL